MASARTLMPVLIPRPSQRKSLRRSAANAGGSAADLGYVFAASAVPQVLGLITQLTPQEPAVARGGRPAGP